MRTLNKSTAVCTPASTRMDENGNTEEGKVFAGSVKLWNMTVLHRRTFRVSFCNGIGSEARTLLFQIFRPLCTVVRYRIHGDESLERALNSLCVVLKDQICCT